MRVWNLYEPLAVRPPNFGPLEMMVAESIEPEHGKADSWVVKIRPGIEFHNGKTVTADDVIFSLKRILDPKDPQGRRGLDRLHRPQGHQEARTSRPVRIPLKSPTRPSSTSSASTSTGSSRTATTPRTPVGTRARSSTRASRPGQRACSRSTPNYWRSGKPYVDQLDDHRLPRRHRARQRAARRPGRRDRQRAVRPDRPGDQGNTSVKVLNNQTRRSGCRSRCASTRRRSPTSACARRSG